MRRVLQFGWLLTLSLLASPALAHGDEGEMTVTVAEQSGPNAVTIEVGILYSDDGHLAEEAVVNALLTASDGTTVGPVELSGITGARYGAEVTVHTFGEWSVVITSENPSAQAQAIITVTETTTTTTTTAATTTTTTAATTTSTAPLTTTTEPPPGDPEGPGVWLPLVIGAVLIGGAALMWAAAASRAPGGGRHPPPRS
jgi:hypothetical protein